MEDMLKEELVCGLFLMCVCYSISSFNEYLTHDYYYMKSVKFRHYLLD